MPHSRTLIRSPFRGGIRPRLRPLTLALMAAGCACTVQADVLPTGMVLKAGVGTQATNTDTSTMTITQGSQRAVWEAGTFSLGVKSTLNIQADSAKSFTLVRVVGGVPSDLNGHIVGNNNFLLVNPFGIQVGGSAVISTGGLLLSARDMDSTQIEGNYKGFMGGAPLVFNTGTLQGGSAAGLVDISPEAQLTVGAGGAIVLIGDRGVRNQGTLSAGEGGSVSLVAAGTATVTVGDSGFIELSTYAEQDTSTMRVTLNAGSISAPNGTVLLASAGSGVGVNPFDVLTVSDTAQANATPGGVSNSGTVLAQGSKGGQGKVSMVAKGLDAAVVQLGTVDVSALDAASKAGQINLSAQNIMATGPSVLRADGPSGGGEITLDNQAGVGGETTSTIMVDTGALLSADASANGAGGQIVLTTKAVGAPDSHGVIGVFGTLQARGGTSGGNGGTVETSADVVVTRWAVPDSDTVKQVHIDVGARAAGAAGGLWRLYSPQVTIGPVGAASYNSDATFGASSTYVDDSTINAVLDTGASVSLSSYRGTDTALGGKLTVLFDTQILRSAGTGGASLSLQSGQDLIVEDGTRIRSTSGKLDVLLQADAAAQGQGSLQIQGSEVGVEIATNGGDLALVGRQTPTAAASTAPLSDKAGADILGATLDTSGEAGRGNITINGTDGGVREGVILTAQTLAKAQIQAQAAAGAVPVANGITLQDSTLTGHNVSIVGHSSAATGVRIANTSIGTDDGRVAITGVAEGGGAVGQPIGVDIGSGVRIDVGQGQVTILGRAVGGVLADAVGLRITDLTLTTPGNGAAPALITLVGQSVDSSGPGILVDGAGLQLHDAQGPLLASTADVIIGGRAGATASQALVLGSPSLRTTGRVNFRPMGVDAQGLLQNDHGTVIRVSKEASSSLTNFIVNPDWFVPLKLHTVIGSNGHTGLISVADAALEGAGAVTLQNQGDGSQGITLGSQKDDALVLSLLSHGDISQSVGGLQVAQLNVLAGPQSKVVLTDSANQIGALSYDNTTQTTVTGQAVPAATSNAGVLGFDSTGATQGEGASAVGTFQNVPITYQATTNPEVPVVTEPPVLPVIPKPFEGPEALRDLRTDVYVRGQLGRPSLCTAANTNGVAGVEAELEPLAQEWTKVRHSAQLTSCSGVRTDSNCSAF